MTDKYKGQHLIIEKAAGAYTHHGLGIGNGKVIHYSGLANDFSGKGVIEELDLEDFSKGDEVLINPHIDRKYDMSESIIRACLRLGEDQYHILHNNCEHFVEWCISGKHRSSQSEKGKILYSAGIGARALVGAKNPIGFVAGVAAGYVYFHHQSMKKTPDFNQLEEEFERIVRFRDVVVYLPYID